MVEFRFYWNLELNQQKIEYFDSIDNLDLIAHNGKAA